MQLKNIFVFSLLLIVTACGGQKKPVSKNNAIAQTAITSEGFNADSAFYFTKKQTDFGPRVPNSTAHQECATFLTQTFTRLGAKVEVQAFTAKGYEGTLWQGKNIIASYLPEAKDRILLSAHWDSRFIAEQDKDESLQHTPIDGANDGASGVGVLLEIARQLQLSAPKIGIDLILFDVEDQGAPSYAATAETEDSWCLGAQHWAHEAVKNNYTARWGILLDMVGASDAVFMKEQISLHYAQQLVDYVWSTAERLGHSNYFINQKGGIVTDDHLYVMRIAKIPCIDIIDYEDTRGGFNPTWHTHDDTIENISKNTLKAVGDVVLEVVYEQ